jgi:hypothetical protein
VVPLFRSAFRVGDPVIPRAVGQLSLGDLHLYNEFMVLSLSDGSSRDETSLMYTFTINTRTSPVSSPPRLYQWLRQNKWTGPAR